MNENQAIPSIDTVRAASSLQPWDLEGNEGRWLEVPRLQQQNPQAPAQSSFWSARASAAMLHNFFARADKRLDEYIGHSLGEAERGPNGIAMNLRWLGGPHQGQLAGISNGQVDLVQLFSAAGLRVATGRLVPYGEPGEPEQARRYFEPILEQLRQNNPVLLFTLLGRSPGHVVVISGYKISAQSELWLRITDPDAPRRDYLPLLEPVTNPTAPYHLFSEYWVPATAFFAAHPELEGARLFEHAGSPGKFLYVVPKAPIDDADELVHHLKPRSVTPIKNPTAAAAEDEGAAADAEGSGEHREDAPKTRGRAELETALLRGQFKDLGEWRGDSFANLELQRILEGCCADDALDPATMVPPKTTGHIAGGDLELTTSEDLPTWYSTWRVRVAQRSKWDAWCAIRARLGEAFSRWFFRQQCESNQAEYPPSADQFLAHLWKSNGNGASGDLGGPGTSFAPAASTLAFTRASLGAGFRIPISSGTQIAEQVLFSALLDVEPAAGDVISVVSAASPRHGHVVTVIAPLTQDWGSGQLWVASGNCAPGGNIAADLLALETCEPGFNPFDTDADGRPLTEWQAGEPRPSPGRAWVFRDQRCSLLTPSKLNELDDASLQEKGIERKPAPAAAKSQP
jgi:hypothetical protein